MREFLTNAPRHSNAFLHKREEKRENKPKQEEEEGETEGEGRGHFHFEERDELFLQHSHGDCGENQNRRKWCRQTLHLGNLKSLSFELYIPAESQRATGRQ